MNWFVAFELRRIDSSSTIFPIENHRAALSLCHEELSSEYSVKLWSYNLLLGDPHPSLEALWKSSEFSDIDCCCWVERAVDIVK
jgi:hypothetical protein